MSVEADLLLVKQKVEQIEAQLSSKITYNQLSTLAGNGLAGSGATTLDVNVDNSTLEINLDTLRVKDGGITSAKILDGSIVAGDIANSTIVAANIANDTLTGTQIAVDAIGSSELADNAVDTAAIAALAVTTAKITDASVTNAKLAADAVTPTGSITAFAAATGAPTSWLACDGTAISRTTYSALFVVIGTTWGVGNGTTTFNLPDLKGRTLAGVEATATRLTVATSGIYSTAVGSTGGDQFSSSHTHAQNPHTHITDAITSNTPGGTMVSLASGYWYNPANYGVQAATAVNQYAFTGASGNVQPTAIIRYIIKT